MTYNEQDIKPNRVISFSKVCVGATSDARWRDVPDEVDQIGYLQAHPYPYTGKGKRGKWLK